MLGLRHALHANPALTPFIVLLLISSVFGALLGGAFLSPFALSLLLQQVAVVGVVGAAQTLVVLTAGIDLSVGAIMVLCSVVMGQLVFRFGLSPSFAVVCGLAVGMLVGLTNGLLVARGRLPPFIVTLGTWQAVLATNFLFSRNETIRSQDIEAEAPLLQLFGLPLEAGGAMLTLGTIAMVALVLALHYVLEHTAWGRHVLAVGDDPAAAELAGVDVQRTLLSVYVLAGLICALSGWMLIGRIGSVSPTSGQTVNIESITAVVIGGISLFGGRGSILGMLFGALTVGAIMVLCSVVMGQLVFRYGMPASFAVVCGLAVGMLIGFINGLLVARVRLPPFIVTLGTWQAVLATNFLFSRNETIRSQDIQAEAPLLQLFGLPLEAGGAALTLGTVAMVAVVLVLHYVLEHTAWGRHVLAVGDDPAAAELAGVNVQRTLLSVYVLAGLICAFGGWMLIGRIGSVSPTSGQTANIESITAVVIGGISLLGGRGSILGMLFGALTVGALGLGLRLAGTDPQWTYLLIGVLMIAAVTIDRWIRQAVA